MDFFTSSMWHKLNEYTATILIIGFLLYQLIRYYFNNKKPGNKFFLRAGVVPEPQAPTVNDILMRSLEQNNTAFLALSTSINDLAVNTRENTNTLAQLSGHINQAQAKIDTMEATLESHGEKLNDVNLQLVKIEGKIGL